MKTHARVVVFGRATARAYCHWVGECLAIGYVKTGHGEPGTELEIEILGERLPTTVIPDSPHDPENARLRA